MPKQMTTIDPKELTSKQRRAWDETRAAALFEAPMFSHLLYSMMSGKNGEQATFSRDVETAACDDTQVIVNPDTFLNRDLGDRVFILCHEICHAMFGHSKQAEQIKRADGVTFADGVKIGYNNKLLAQAEDYFVNALLRDSKIGTLPSDALLDPRFTTKNAVLDIYRTIYEEDKKNNPPPDDQPEGDDGLPGTSPGGFDHHLPPGAGSGQSPQEAMDERDDDRWAAETQAAADGAKARGKLPAALEEALGRIKEVSTDWRDHMRALLDKAAGMGSYDWRTPDRRMISRPVDPIFAPGRRGFRCRLLVVVGDSSGSINQPTEEMFMSQLAGMIDDLAPQRILFAWVDARVHGWQELSDLDEAEELAKRGAKGRGGTDFRPPFAEIEAMGETPDALIYLTDGDGPFMKDPPPYQVIWGDITGNPGKYPWGDVVHVPVQKG